MKDPDWFVRSLFPPKRRLPPKVRTSGRPPLTRLPEEPKRPPLRPPLPSRSGLRSPFHP